MKSEVESYIENNFGKLKFFSADKVKSILDGLIGEFDVLDVFICEERNEAGGIEPNSLWIISEDRFIECEDFMNKTQFRIFPYINGFSCCNIWYDEQLPNQFSFSAKLRNGIELKFVAFGLNCKKAKEILENYILPNVS